MSQFGFDSTADEVLADQDLTGRTAFITGAYSGLGHETARAMGARGARLILSGRDESKLEAAAKTVGDETGAKVETLVCDLASLDSVRTAGKEANARFDTIDLLINNAGVMACPLSRTADGFELQFGTNHLGHFVLTARLIDNLSAATPTRIVNLSSGGHRLSPLRFEDPFFERDEYNKFTAYGQAKTANVLFSVALDKRFKDRGIRSYAVHPGAIQTELSRHMDRDDIKTLMSSRPQNEPMKFKTLEAGAATTVWAATAAELDGKGGVYCEDCNVADVIDEPGASCGVVSWAVDDEAAEKLWTLSEQWSGQAFPA